MIQYILNYDFNASERLEDAILYAALRQELGGLIVPHDPRGRLERDTPVWGRDAFRIMSDRIETLSASYRDPHVREALDGQILHKWEVPKAMERLSQGGYGASLRNMRDPERLVRHCAPGDRFEQHETAIRADAYAHEIFVHPNRGLTHVRRFLVVAGECAAETPYRFCEETPMDLLDPTAWEKQAVDFMAPLVHCDPAWRALQRAEADRLLSRFPMVSGAIDVGLKIARDGSVRAHVEEVVAAPPGAFSTFFADTRAYAAAVRENLPLLVPDLDGAAPEP